MINIHHVILAIAILAPVVLTLRESDLGSNDWSVENIGKINQLNFPTFNHDE